MIKKICFVWFSLILINTLVLGAKSCINRSRNTKSGSSTNTFMINAPSNLTATAVSSSQINLTWQDNSNNEDGFEIYRRIEGTDYLITSTAIVVTNVTSYSDFGFFPANTYYYRVRAFNSIGDRSDYSNETNVTPLNLVWSAVATFGLHTLALTTDGTLWSWGTNYNGQLGLGFTNNYLLSPDPAGTETDWTAVAAGDAHSLAIKTDGTLWSWGANALGQLGMGDTQFENWVPYQIFYPPEATTDWIAVIGGYGYTIALKSNPAGGGTIWAWGGNYRGQLGLGYTLDENTGLATPTQIGTQSDWSISAVGWYHSITLKTNGTIWGWGQNDEGQLGLDDFIDRWTPTQIGTDSSWAIAATNYHNTIALKTNGSAQPPVGTIWSWGNNDYGQLGLGDSGFGMERNTPTQIGTASDWSVVTTGGSGAMGGIQLV
jgi:hypothetical protein